MTTTTTAVATGTLLSARHLRAAYEDEHGDLISAVDDMT